MAPLAEAANINLLNNFQTIRQFGTKSSTTVYAGGFVGIDPSDGYTRALVAGDLFIGICNRNTVGGAADGDVNVPTLIEGNFKWTLSGADAANNGSCVYATDDNVISLTPSTTAKYSFVGYQIDKYDTNEIVLKIAPFAPWGFGFPNQGRAISSAETLTIFDINSTFFCDTSGGAFTITLPAAATCRYGKLTFVLETAGAILTLDGNGAETINGSATNVEMDAQYDTITIESDGTNWLITNKMIDGT